MNPQPRLRMVRVKDCPKCAGTGRLMRASYRPAGFYMPGLRVAVFPCATCQGQRVVRV